MDKIIQNYKNVLLSWGNFQGRASRSEYWYFALANICVSIVLGIVDNVVFHPGTGNAGPLQSIYGLVVLVPGLAVSFRRIHDISKSAWWLLIGLIPIFGWAVYLYFMVKDSDADNVYGPNPKQIAAS